MDFLQKPLAWFSKFYLRVQSKNCGRISFFLFFFSEFFRIFSNIFSDFWPKNFKKLSNYPVRKQTNNFWLEFFFYSFESLWVFCRNLWHSPKTSIFVSRVKIPWGEFFLFFFLEFFPDFERNIFQTSGQKTSGSFQNYLLRFQEKSLWLEIFLQFWVVLDFLQKPLAWFSKFYLRVQSKNCGRLSFFCFSLQNFFRIFSKIFSDFWPKNFKNLSN